MSVRVRIPMVSRDPEESHRVATPLELFFDLTFVVAVAQAANSLHHGLAEGHAANVLVGYPLVFFGLWWAWMNFTWFASAFDVDDAMYRAAVFVQMAGVLVYAAGVPRAMEHGDFGLGVTGYVIMRIGLLFHWLRAARSDPEHRPCCLRYAAGIAACQVYWIVLVAFLPHSWLVPGFVLGAALEVAVPVLAERVTATTWHPHHIAERYGLFTIIVLGESVLAATLAVQQAVDAGDSLRRPRDDRRGRPADRLRHVVDLLRPARRAGRRPRPAGHDRGRGRQLPVGLRPLPRVRQRGRRPAPASRWPSTRPRTTRRSPTPRRASRSPSRWPSTCWSSGSCTPATSGQAPCARSPAPSRRRLILLGSVLGEAVLTTGLVLAASWPCR